MLFPMMMFQNIRNEAEEQKKRVEACKYRSEDWDEDKTKFNTSLVLNGATWKPYKVFRLRRTTLPGAEDRLNKGKTSPSGKFTYVHQILPAGGVLKLAQGRNRRGEVFFTEDVIIPTLLEGNQIWMSYTPSEIITQRGGVRRATGTVLVGGLGMGWMLRKIAAKKSVKKIILVEIEQDLMDFYGNKMVGKIRQETGVEIEVHVGDVWDHVGKHGADVRHILDIWPSYPAYPNRNERAIISTVRHFWGWGVQL